jgi:hypothetical protein
VTFFFKKKVQFGVIANLSPFIASFSHETDGP